MLKLHQKKMQNKLTKILKDLESKKIIVFRKFKNAYALFSGSDIDLDELNGSPT